MNQYLNIKDKITPSYNFRMNSILVVDLIHVPVRYYLFGEILSPPLMWFLLLTTLPIIFMNHKKSRLVIGITALEVLVTSFLIKIDSFSPFAMEKVTGLEINTLLGVFAMVFALSTFINELQNLKNNYFRLLEK